MSYGCRHSWDRLCFGIVLPLVLASTVNAQSADYCFVPASALAPALPAQLVEGVGAVQFPIATVSPEAQAFFNQGMAFLYAFWFVEAERSFLQAASIDSSAAMAYWGVAMSATGDFRPGYQLFLDPNRRLPAIPAPGSPESRARDAILKASVLRSGAPDRERMYIEAVAARHNPRLRDPDAEYVRALRRIVAAYPDDTHAATILGVALSNGYDSPAMTAREGTVEGINLLQRVLAKHPDHVGAQHAFLHALEGGPRREEALEVAQRYPKLAPAIPHVLHMPGHIYAQTGRFDAAIDAFEVARTKEREYIDHDATYGREHYFHNQMFLVYVLGSAGRVDDALQRVSELIAVPENPRERAAADALSSYRQGWFSLMRTLVRFERWEDLLDPSKFPLFDKPVQRVWYHWAKGLASANSGDITSARESLQSMESSLSDLRRLINPVPHTLFVARTELEGVISVRSGRIDDGLRELAKAATAEAELLYTEPPTYPRPVNESLGRQALESGRYSNAESAFRQALEREPGSGRALWGIAAALEGLGKASEAERFRSLYRESWKGPPIAQTGGGSARQIK